LESETTYIFTSGTTGIPKGVIYTHRMVVTQLHSLGGMVVLFPQDIHISYLPIAHIFERFMIWLCIFSGTNIRYTVHPISEIARDLANIRPTVMPIVPRLLNKLYPLLKGLYEREGNATKAQAFFGGRLRFMLTGSAPVSPTILRFFTSVLNVLIIEVYGQTETVGGSFATAEGDHNYGHVGGPNHSVEFKLVDVPEMNYTSKGSVCEGEVCLRGPSIFQKYFKDPKNTALTVDRDGWNHTGDIGRILPNGALQIIDRKKSIYKLQQG
jgi:long-chain acyl-CoA synthetase